MDKNKMDTIAHDAMLLSLDGMTPEKVKYLTEEGQKYGIGDEKIKEMMEQFRYGEGIPKALRTIWSKRQGKDFEKFMVANLSKAFDLIGWTCDKFPEDCNDLDKSQYASTVYYPDLILQSRNKPWFKLAVECKWHEFEEAKSIRVSTKQQLAHYKIFQKEKKIPVFVAIGIGNIGMYPNDIYIFPLDMVDNTRMSISLLYQYRVTDKDTLCGNIINLLGTGVMGAGT